MEERHLKAVLAHEFGHIANNDSERQASIARLNERKADIFAAQHGYGPDLIEAFSRRSERDITDPRPPKWWDHPSREQRIDAIRRWKP